MKISTKRSIIPLAAAVVLLACIALALNGAISKQRTTTLFINYKTAHEMPVIGDPDEPLFVVDSGGQSWRVENVWLWKSIHENASYLVTFYAGFVPDMGIYPTIVEAVPTQPTPYTHLGNNPTHQAPNFPYPPLFDKPEFIYGIGGNFSTLSYEWMTERNATLLQPRWLPEGMKATAVYVLRANRTANIGLITQVTRLYSFGSDADPNTAELQVRVQMVWDEAWINPRNLHDNTQLKGNYTEVDGKSAWMGVIGFFHPDWYQMYGENALIMSIQLGNVRYLLKVPEGFPEADLMKIARSMGFY